MRTNNMSQATLNQDQSLNTTGANSNVSTFNADNQHETLSTESATASSHLNSEDNNNNKRKSTLITNTTIDSSNTKNQNHIIN